MDSSYFLYLVVGGMAVFTGVILAVGIEDALRRRRRDG